MAVIGNLMLALFVVAPVLADAPASPQPGEPVARAPAPADATMAPALAPINVLRAKAFRDASVEQILAAGREALGHLGVYRVKLTKQERIGKALQEPQVLWLTVREQPLAIRMEFVQGPVGRKLIYDSTTRPEELRVHEHGFLGILGAQWISIHSSLVRGDSNHLITDAGLGALLRLQTTDMLKAKAFGGFSRNDEGWNGRGRWCIRYDAPQKATGLYAVASRVCLDPATWLPMEMTVWDARGLLESYLYGNLEPNLAGGKQQFDLGKAGL